MSQGDAFNLANCQWVIDQGVGPSGDYPTPRKNNKSVWMTFWALISYREVWKVDRKKPLDEAHLGKHIIPKQKAAEVVQGPKPSKKILDSCAVV